MNLPTESAVTSDSLTSQPPKTIRQAIAAGLRRSTPFGAITALVLMAPVFVFGLIRELSLPQMRENVLAAIELLKYFGGGIGGLLVAACWRAVVGSASMTVATLV